MLRVSIAVNVTKEMKSTEVESRDSSSTVKKVGSGVVKALIVSTVLDWVRKAYNAIIENLN